MTDTGRGEPGRSTAIGAVLSGVEKLLTAGPAANGTGGVAFDSLGGAVNRVSPGATAFVHRDGLFLAQYTTDWPSGAPAAAVSRQQAWLLAQVKARYDPGRLFRFPQAIG